MRAAQPQLRFVSRGKSKQAVDRSQIPPSPYGPQVRANPSSWLKQKPALMVDLSFAAQETPGKDVVLYLVAKGGEATVNKGSGDNPAIALMTVLGSNAPAKVINQRDDDRRLGVDPRAVPRRHRDQGPRAWPAHRRRQRAQLRRSSNRRLGRSHPGPAQQRPDADDGQLRHAGRRAFRLRHAGDSRMRAASSSLRPHHQRATPRPTR